MECLQDRNKAALNLTGCYLLKKINDNTGNCVSDHSD